MAKSTVYIDESGDLGYGTGTKWFVITAVVVEREKESSIRQKMDADIVLSARGTSRDGELIQYIKDKLMPYENNRIEQGVFKKIYSKTANSWDMLQLADVCATTTFLAHEMNAWGFRIPCHFNVLKGHLYKYKGNVMRYGIKYFSDEMIPIKGEIEQNFPCKIKERTPGTTTT